MTTVAAHLELKVVSASSLVDIARLEELERLQAFAFSAVTFEIKGKPYIVTNPIRAQGRIASDLAHEMSHILLKHELSEVSEFEGVPFRTCRPDEEEQTTALGEPSCCRAHCSSTRPNAEWDPMRSPGNTR
jgi:hypothetical protein